MNTALELKARAEAVGARVEVADMAWAGGAGVHITFANGLGVSIIRHRFAYCSMRDNVPFETEDPDFEVALLDRQGNIDPDVQGWLRLEGVQRLIDMQARRA